MRRLDISTFSASSHALGGGRFHPDAVQCDGASATLTMQSTGFVGAEIVSPLRYGAGTFIARMRTPRLPGSITAFFLYETGAAAADEIDIEIYNDGTRRVLFTIWCSGVQTHSVGQALPFDPADAMHEYRIVRSAQEIAFVADDVVMERVTGSLPERELDVRVSGWWPLWVPAPAEGIAGAVVLEEIVVAD